MDIIQHSPIRNRRTNRILLGKEQKMTREESISLIKSAQLMLVNPTTNEPVSDLYEALEMAISALEQNESAEKWYKLFVEKLDEQEPCEDAISREAAINIASLHCLTIDESVEALKQLPSVQPSRKGHWIIKDRYYHDTITAECSECGREVEIPTCMSELMYKGCPYCMAEMVEPQESEDKE